MIDWSSPLRGSYGISDAKLKLGSCARCGKSENFAGMVSRIPCKKCGKITCWECADCGVYGSLSDFQSFVMRRTEGGKDVYLASENCRNCQETTWWKKYASKRPEFPPSNDAVQSSAQHYANKAKNPLKPRMDYPVNPHNLEEVRFLWSEVTNEAEDVLSGKTSLLKGAHELACLGQRLSPTNTDADFYIFQALSSETDHLPVGEDRKNWNEAALKAKDEEIQQFERLYRERVFEACRELLKKRKTMNEIDKRGKLTAEPFSYRASKDGKVFITWNGKQVLILKGAVAQKFLTEMTKADTQEAQLLMARVTGNFRRGNEKNNSDKQKSPHIF